MISRYFKKQAGFTLVEVMVALVIISVALLALAGLLITAIKTNKGSEQRMDVAAVSMSVLSECTASLAAGGGCAVGTDIASPYQGFTIVSLTVTGTGPRVITVTLRPASGNRMLADFTNSTVAE